MNDMIGSDKVASRSFGSLQLLQYEQPDASWMDDKAAGIWKYAALLPPVASGNRLSLGEGRTPLIRSVSLEKRLGIGELYFKYEGGNPTGSYKDRIATIGLSWALEQRRTACVGTTSGNAGAAVAAYAARAGLPYHLYVLEHMAEAKLTQVLAYGANVRRVAEFGTSPEVGDRVFRHVLNAAVTHDWELMVTAFRFNTHAMEGVKTIAYEIAEQLGGCPDTVYAPAGGAGLYVGIWKGFDEWQRFSLGDGRKPHMVAVQPEGCSNIVRAYEQGALQPLPGASTSLISGLQVPNPPDGEAALAIMDAGDGSALAVSDDEIWQAQRLLAREEGIFCEPAGAAAVAGLIRTCQQRQQMGERIVCLISGVGFKDFASITAMTQDETVPLLTVSDLNAPYE
ncbi:pyridoxal-phosphate dependent enzyme [Paenibacillus sp. J5C_2022]|uniref:pyridoxal-phosphate dependent enzyme n=1 Tax=Paenibacillus sp. J5C2022 TaxID=2977129 RepID=UPI0021D1F678|nr:pyridoxal-phosphate dependent enzyme [Paenibacillus sp. J5C2022]MCU6712626.1 pyridoxal-phosphate dependent enzyme [Paenibacillus sp. J5C2022]